MDSNAPNNLPPHTDRSVCCTDRHLVKGSLRLATPKQRMRKAFEYEPLGRRHRTLGYI
jgi:hypothetical protein